jgi:hypothetical protein
LGFVAILLKLFWKTWKKREIERDVEIINGGNLQGSSACNAPALFSLLYKHTQSHHPSLSAGHYPVKLIFLAAYFHHVIAQYYTVHGPPPPFPHGA